MGNKMSIAQILGRRGGKARACKLSPVERRKIALLGARARMSSIEASKRIESNFRYLNTIHQLRGIPKVIRVKTCHYPLPNAQTDHGRK